MVIQTINFFLIPYKVLLLLFKTKLQFHSNLTYFY